MSFISVDPGLDGTGVVIWEDISLKDQNPKHVISWRYSTKDLYMSMFDALLKRTKPLLLICEDAAFFQGDKRGEVCARTGKLVKLARFIGSIEEVCRQNKVKCILVPVMTWKGQLPKGITKKRVLKMWPKCTATTSHAFDAVAIGYWRLGRF